MKGIIHSYIHLAGRLGVLIEVHCETDFVAQHESFRALANDLCLHIAAANPGYLDRGSVPLYVVEREKEILAAQVKNKPAEVVEKIVEGKMNKFFGDFCFLEQAFIKNPEVTVMDFIHQKMAELGEKLVVYQFVRYAVC